MTIMLSGTWEWRSVLASKKMKPLLLALQREYNPLGTEAGYQSYRLAAIIIWRFLRAVAIPSVSGHPFGLFCPLERVEMTLSNGVVVTSSNFGGVYDTLLELERDGLSVESLKALPPTA